MRNLSTIITAGVILLISGTARADLGDQLFKQLPNDGAFENRFGISVAINEKIALVGAYFSDDNGYLSGSAYLFDITTGQQISKLLPDDGSTEDQFGCSVAISNNIAIIGALTDDYNGRFSGSAYLFDSTTGQQLFKLLPNDGVAGAVFGNSVAISGSIAVVGAKWDDDNGFASGSAYLFDVNTGQQIVKLLPDDGSREDYFGISVGIGGSLGNEIVIVGNWRDNDNGSDSGSAYLFDASTGQQITKLLPDDGDSYDGFGFSVGISGTTAIIGAMGDDDRGYLSGSAYLFDISTGQQIVKLLAEDATEDDWFGFSVAIHGNIAVIGSKNNDENGLNSGAAYLFDITTGQQLTKILPNDGETIDEFGYSVSLHGNNTIVGAYLDDDNGTDSGSAYIFDATISTIAVLTEFNVANGTLLSGELTDVETSDDLYVHTRSGFGETVVDLHNMEMLILAEAPGNNPTEIELTIESRIDEPAGLAQISMKNFNTTDFDVIDTYSISNFDAVKIIQSIDASKYYNTNNGRMRVKIKHLVFVPFLAFTFESFIDQVEIVVE